MCDVAVEEEECSKQSAFEVTLLDDVDGYNDDEEVLQLDTQSIGGKTYC